MDEDHDQIIGLLNENSEEIKQVEKDSTAAAKEPLVERNTILFNV